MFFTQNENHAYNDSENGISKMQALTQKNNGAYLMNTEIPKKNEHFFALITDNLHLFQLQ
ncbi:hypothetical protein [Lacibacter sp.]|uniref:hypothetical protein n=1 Tax=Lacibacter sp. TaxID=1915409 RepID=UPI002B4AC2EE|nr:hypothetical protein [Lacibacter sp.]HLP37602.1 hypothetical protein [Lacibacter sp.]